MREQMFVRLVWSAQLTAGLACWAFASIGVAHVQGL